MDVDGGSQYDDQACAIVELSAELSAQREMSEGVRETVTVSSGAVIPNFVSAAQMYAHMASCVATGTVIHYLSRLVFATERAHIVPTELFPEPALEAYTAKNLGQHITPEQAQWFTTHRGGLQGDYSDRIQEKMRAVVTCLKERPRSKRAYIVIPNNTVPDAREDADAKCMQMLNLMLEQSVDGVMQLNASVLFRAQAVEIFPKNIHFIGELLLHLCGHLQSELAADIRPGHLIYHACFLVSTRAS